MKIFRSGWLVLAAVTSVECGAMIPEPKEFRLLDGSVSTNVAVVCRKDASIPHEGYNLKIARDGVLVVSSGDAGFFYARQTLQQLEDNGTWPCCEIVDAPRYRWRGVHLDVSRHFFDVDVVKRFLDKAAEYKFNVFHWHLMDDQGCRLPLPEYPRMATIGATRPSPDYSRWIHDLCDPGQYGPFVYSREDIREVVEHAASLHITVLPEIEFPGHSREVLMAYPELFCSDTLHLREAVTMCNADGAPLKFGAEPALDKSALCVGNDATLALARHLIDVVCELFPGEYIHIGGDECDKRNWRQCQRCQARMRAEGLKDEKELQSWAVRQLVAHVGAKGRKAIGWEEIMEGGLAKDVAVMSWLGPEAGIQAAVAGHDVVMATHTNCYFCYTQAIPNDSHDVLPPGVKGDVLPIEKVYSFDPDANVPKSAQRHILGGQAFLWSEQVPNESWIQWKMWPRALAMSEVLWSGPRKRSFAAFKADADSVVRKLRNAGFNAATVATQAVDAADAPVLHADDGIRAYSMLTHDGRRLVSRGEGTNTVYELVPTNRLPAGLPPAREWKLYGLKATHTDIGLHNSQYIQRHGTVKRIDEAARLIDADTRADDDPAAYRYVMEGFWFWDNYHQDKGMDAAWRIVTNYVARGRMDVGVTCAGNHTHLFSETEIERSTLTKRILAEKWGIGTRTFIMADNPGISCSVIAPYSRAGIKYGLFLPNQWNPIPSTIWRKNESISAGTWNPDAMGGGARVEVSYDSPLPMVFRWKAPGGDESLLMWCSTQYGHGYSRLGISGRKKSAVDDVERLMPKFLGILEGKYPYDIWIAATYGDDESPNTKFADFAAEWNAKWAWPQFRTVGRLDEPFEYLEAKFGDKIPTLTGEMTSGWLQHAASTPELLADKLNADRMLETAERLGSFAETIDQAAVDRAWWYLILNDEHSYGTSGYQGRRVFETWMQHRDWIERAAETASNELAKAVSKLGLFTNDNCHNCSQITNTSSTCSTRLIPVKEYSAPLRPCVKDNPVKNGTAENRWYRVVVTNGVIYSIYDKELKRELIDGPVNKLLYTRDNHKTWEADPENALGAKVTRRVCLPDDAKRIDIIDTFEHARDLFNTCRYYRYGYLAFPFAVPGGAFVAHLNGAVVRPYEDCHPMTSDAYCAVRDWCAVENGDFGVALMMRDSTLTEFGEIHSDKTCYTGKPPAGKTAIYPYIFTDWLQMHQPDGDSMNFTFRFSITSYRGSWKNIDVPRLCEDWLNSYAKWMRAHNVPQVMRETVVEPPPGWTGLIERPRAGHGEEDGQMYILWGAEMSPDFDHYELYRDGKFLANVTNEVPDGIPYRVARYEDTGLPTHSRHEYRLRKVWKDGRKGELGEPFYGVTRYMSDEERHGIACEGEYGRMYVRYDGATVTSWKPEALKGREVFFMPEKTPWGKEVHGGLPICWPWFGKREGCPKHGLGRYLKWRFAWRFGKDSVLLETESSADTMKVWPHPFKLRALLSVDGPDALTIKFTETNTGEQPYESAFGVHPYFAVADACEVALDGERLPSPWVIKDFAADGKSHELQDFAGKVAYSVMSSGNDTWYVWNPGVERTPLCETLGPDEWRRFYCLEPFMCRPRLLAPGESREHVVRIAVSGL